MKEGSKGEAVNIKGGQVGPREKVRVRVKD